MEILDDLRGRRIYLDTNVFIYAVKAVAEYREVVEGLFALIEDGAVDAVTSELALGEALAKPLEVGRFDVAQVYESMLTPSAWLSVAPVERSILIEAARLQAPSKLRLPHAIHVATAIATGCSAVLSNDRPLRVPPGIELVHLKS